MTLRLQIIIIVGFLFILLSMLNLVKKRVIDLKHTLSWILCILALIVLTLFPSLLVSLSSFLGIYSPVNMVFLFGFIFLLIVCFHLTVTLSKLTDKVRRIDQILAIETKKNKDE